MAIIGIIAIISLALGSLVASRTTPFNFPVASPILNGIIDRIVGGSVVSDTSR